jgi:hypothetical protein
MRFALEITKARYQERMDSGNTLGGGVDMVSFLKKLFGKVEQASVQAQDQAKSADASARSAADSAQSQAMGARHGLTDAAANLQNQAGTAASGAQNQARSALGNAQAQASATVSDAQAKAADSGSLLTDVVNLFEGGMPNLGEIEAVISKLSGSELSGILGGAMNSVPADSRNQLGQLVNQKAPGAAAGATSGVAAGNPADLGNALSGILKGGGISALAGLFGGGGAAASGVPGAAPASSGGGGGGLLGQVMGAATGGSGLDLGAIMNNPLAKQVLSAILPAIMKAAGK